MATARKKEEDHGQMTGILGILGAGDTWRQPPNPETDPLGETLGLKNHKQTDTPKKFMAFGRERHPEPETRIDSNDEHTRKKRWWRKNDLTPENETREKPEPSRLVKPHNPAPSLTSETKSETWVSTKPSIGNWSNSDSVERHLNDTSQREVVYNFFGGSPSDSLVIEQTPGAPEPESPYHVVVKISASTVTLRDCLLRRGIDFSITDPVHLPATPGYDFVGYVVSCGEEAKLFQPGVRVAGLVRTGGNARYICVHESTLVEVPKPLDSLEAACMVSIFATAYQCLKLVAPNNTIFSLYGKKVLVVGGMDGVGQALIQMCRKAKADVYATGPTRRHAYIRHILGATPLPCNANEWSLIVDCDMDLVFDAEYQGGLATARKALNDNGKLVCFGHSDLIKEDMGIFGAPISAHMERLQAQLLPSNVTTFDLWESFQSDPETYKKNLTALFQLLRWKKIKPHIAKQVSLDEVCLAHEKLETGQVRGTVVCQPWKRAAKNKIVQGRVNS